MPFGLTNAPSTFQYFMNEQLVGMELFAHVYMDDIIVFSHNVHEHMAYLRQVLARMQAHQLAVKERKCEFMRHRLTFLGHVVLAGGVSPDPTKVEAIAQLAAPADVSQLRSFFGLLQLLRTFHTWLCSHCIPTD